MARKVVKTFSAGSNYKDIRLPAGSNPGTPQCMAVLNNDTVVVVHNEGNANVRCHLRKYTSNGYVSGSDVVNRNLEHGTGMTYCHKTNYIYCTTGGKKIVVMNTNLKQVFTFRLKTKTRGIAYDPVVDRFYTFSGSKIYVYPTSAFYKTNRTTKYINKFKVKYSVQDIGGYNGVVYKVSYDLNHGYLDMYAHSTGKYLGSIYISFSETESCGFTSSGNLVYLTARIRGLHWTKYKPPYKDGQVASTAAAATATTTTNAASAFVAKAKSQVGTKESGNNNVKYNTWYYGHAVNGGDYAWCAVFVMWCANEALGDYKKVFNRNAMAHGVQESAVTKGGQWILKGSFPKNAASAAMCQPGDIITFDPNGNGTADHVGIIEKVNGTTIHTIEGNHGDKVDAVKRSISEVFRVARPKWPGGSYTVNVYNGEETAGGAATYGTSLQVSPDKLFSSENYKYLDQVEEESEESKKTKERQKAIKEFLENISVDFSDTVTIPDVNLISINSVSKTKKPKTKISGDISGSSLPSTINYVEAPYVKVTLGGVSIGTYTNKNYPNYINGINVKKTNGSLNEYTINLIHQISPGDNPNYIDNLISKNGYNKIQIEYGDAEGGISYRDINALIVDVQSKFDFFNNSISYTIKATSSSVMSAVHRVNYPAVTAKPSNVLDKMLYETGELLEYFPGMANKSFVSSNNLIPTNDQEVSLNAVSNTTPLNYMNTLVSSMKSVTGNGGDYTYYLTINDEKNSGSYFKIEQVKTALNASMFPLIYEIDINYPDEKSLAYNFSVNTDYAWPLAYQYTGSFPTYTYNIDAYGKVLSQKSRSNLKSTTSTLNSFISDQNWWTNVTEFPITATLEVKGLTSYLLLLNYIKVNVFYFGNKRNSSGVYIVTGQEDSLSGSGFRTKLDLLRVAGDNQYISVDGRVVS